MCTITSLFLIVDGLISTVEKQSTNTNPSVDYPSWLTRTFLPNDTQVRFILIEELQFNLLPDVIFLSKRYTHPLPHLAHSRYYWLAGTVETDNWENVDHILLSSPFSSIILVWFYLSFQFFRIGILLPHSEKQIWVTFFCDHTAVAVPLNKSPSTWFLVYS